MSRLQAVWLALPIAAVVGALYGPVLSAPPGFVPATHDSDFFMYYFPMTELAFGMLREGRLPLWNPYLFSGMPLLASIEVGVLYPPNWLHLIVSSERAFCLAYVLHVGLALGGMWRLARRLGRSPAAAAFSAVAFALAAPTILHHDKGMTSVVYSAAWIPAVLALVDRTRLDPTAANGCRLAGALACQFLAGFPLFTFVLGALIGAYLATFAVDWRCLGAPLHRRRLLIFLGAAGLALGLVCPQLLPTWEYLGESRRADLSYQQATHSSLPPANLLTLVVPEFFGNDHECPYWGESPFSDAVIFCGATTLLLALVGLRHANRRQAWFWAAVTAVALGLALGKRSFFYDLCYLYVPWISRFRAMSRLSIFAIFGLTLLAGLGVEVVSSSAAPRTRRRLGAATALLAAVLLAFSATQLISGATPPDAWRRLFAAVRAPGTELFIHFPTEAVPEVLRLSYRSMLANATTAAVALLSAGLLIGFHERWVRRPHAVSVSLLALVACELYAFDSQYVILADAAPWREIARRAQAALPDEDGDLYRVAGFSADPPLAPNRFLYGRLQSVGGHENFVLARYSYFLEAWCGIAPEWQTFLTIPNYSRVYDVLNVKYYFAPAKQVQRGPADELLQERVFRFQDHEFALFRNDRALPRAFLVHQASVVRDFESALAGFERLFHGGVATNTIVEGDPGLELQPPPADEAALERVRVLNYAPGRVVLDVRCRAPALMVYVANYYPGWEAVVDGKPAPVLPANIFMRAVPVPAGDHRVEMVYRPRSFQVGCLLGAGALLLLTVGLCWRPRPLCSGEEPRPTAARPAGARAAKLADPVRVLG